MLERYLEEFAASAGRELSTGETQALVAETRAHLEDSIQARLELGVTPEEAEREALAAFGEARRIGQEVRRREPLIDRRFLLVALTSVVYWAWFGYGRSFPGWAFVPLVGTAFALHGAYLLASLKARRPQLLTLLLIFVPLWIAISAPNTVGDLVVPFPGGERVVEPFFIGTPQRHRAFATSIRTRHQNLWTAYDRFVQGEIQGSPGRFSARFDARNAPLLAPHRDGAARWRVALERSASDLSVARNNELLAATIERGGSSHWRALPYEMAKTFRQTGWPLASTYFGMHLFGWSFGVLLRRRKASRRPPRVLG